MRFRLEIDAAQCSVTAGAQGTVVIDGESFVTSITRPSTTRRLVKVGDRTYDIRVIDADPEQGRFTLEVAGERVQLIVSEVEKEASAAQEMSSRPITASSRAASAPSRAVSGGTQAAGEEARAGAPGASGRAEQGGSVTPAAQEAGHGTRTAALPVEDEAVYAPLPGKIVRVLVQVGDAIAEGQSVVVLEAMKMENELRSPRGGRVVSVFVKPGETVGKDQPLVAIR